MEIKSFTLEDYKKWLLYSFDATDIQNLYDLYCTVKTGKGNGQVTCTNAVHRDTVAFIISLPGIEEHLLLTESTRVEFLRYLHDQYFYTNDVDTWYREKMAVRDKEKNLHNVLDVTENSPVSDTTLIAHPKEIYYLRIRIFFSVLFYIAVLSIIGYSLVTSPSGIFLFLLAIPVFALLWFLKFAAQGLFVGIIKGNSIEVTAQQYPEIFAIVKEEARRIGLKDLPRIYITNGDFNAFVTSFARSKIMMLFSQVVETTLQKDYNVMRFVAAHELCHLQRRHLAKDKFLLPSRLIPFLYNAYSRGREYTCDRAGYLASPRGSVEGILIMTTGKEVYSKINVESHLKNFQENADFWTWLSEKFLSHPHSSKRLMAIREFSKR